MKIRLFLRPNPLKLVFVLIGITLTLLLVVERDATSKVTWNESRGAPLPFLTVIEYRGPCPPHSYCTRVDIKAFHPVKLLVDILGWYVLSCTLFFVYKRAFSSRSFPFTCSA